MDPLSAFGIGREKSYREGTVGKPSGVACRFVRKFRHSQCVHFISWMTQIPQRMSCVWDIDIPTSHRILNPALGGGALLDL